MEFKCQIHPHQTFTFYCMTHGVPCCSSCKRVSHQPTCDMQVIDPCENEKDVGLKMANAIKRMNKANVMLDELNKQLSQSKTHLLKQSEKFEHDLRQFRQQLDAHIDELENNIRDHFNDMYEKELVLLKQKEVGIMRKKNSVNNWITDIEEIARNESNLQSYVNLSKITNSFSVIEKHVSKTEDRPQCVTFSFKVSELQEFVKGLKLAHTFIEKTVSSEKIKCRTDSHVAIKKQQKSDDLSLQKVGEFIIVKDTDFQSPSDMCVMPNGTIVVVNLNNRRLVVYDQDGLSEVEMELSHNPLNITGSGNDVVAMTLVNEKKIVVLSIEKRQVLQQIAMDDESHGITYSNGKLVVNCKTKGLYFLGLNYEVETILPDITGKLLLCGHGDGTIIYGGLLSKSITCIDTTGHRLFVCSPQGLDYLNGISVSNHGDIYVTGFISNTVHKISKTGESSVILSDEEGVNLPRTICFDNTTNAVIIINNDGETVDIFRHKKL